MLLASLPQYAAAYGSGDVVHAPFCHAETPQASFVPNPGDGHELHGMTGVLQDYTNNLRATEFQCCQSGQGYVSGLQIWHEPVISFNDQWQTGPPQDYYIPNSDWRTASSNCLGECHVGCLPARSLTYPRYGALTEIAFVKDTSYGLLLDIIIRETSAHYGVDLQTSLCFAGIIPDGYPGTARVTEAISGRFVGFEATYSTLYGTFLTLSAVSNTCPISENTATLLDLGDHFAEPVMVQLSDTDHIAAGTPFHQYFALPAFPSFSSEAPLDFSTLSGLSASISYTLLEDGSTPSYLDLGNYDASIGGYYLTFTNNPSNWPTEARHDFIKISYQMGSYFTVSRVIEVNFYEFDAQLGDDKCYHKPVAQPPVDTLSTYSSFVREEKPMEAVALTQAYRTMNGPGMFACCMTQITAGLFSQAAINDFFFLQSQDEAALLNLRATVISMGCYAEVMDIERATKYVLVRDADFDAGYFDFKIFDAAIGQYRSACYSGLITAHPYNSASNVLVEVDVAEHGFMIGAETTVFKKAEMGPIEAQEFVANLDIVTNRCPFTPERLAYSSNPDAQQVTVATNQVGAEVNMPATTFDIYNTITSSSIPLTETVETLTTYKNCFSYLPTADGCNAIYALGFAEPTTSASFVSNKTKIQFSAWSQTLAQSVIDNWHQAYATSDFSAPSVGLHYKWKRQIALYKYESIYDGDYSHYDAACALTAPNEKMDYQLGDSKVFAGVALSCADDFLADFVHYAHFDSWTVLDDPVLGATAVEVPGLITKEVPAGRRLDPEASNAGNWVFYTADEGFLGQDMLLTQSANIYFAEFSVGHVSEAELDVASTLLPDRTQKVTKQSQFEMHIWPSCDGIYMYPIYLDAMAIGANSQAPSVQAVPLIEDEHDLLLAGLCGTLEPTVLFDGVVVDWITANLQLITVSAPMTPSVIGQHVITFQVRFPGSDVVVEESQFLLTIDDPYCGYLSFDAAVAAYQPTAMEIGFDAVNTMATYGALEFTQAIPVFNDMHGFVSAGYCATGTDLELGAQADGIGVFWLQVSLVPREIVLSVPNDAADAYTSTYIGDRAGRLNVKYDGVVLFTKDFTITIHGPDCSFLDLIVMAIPNLEFTPGAMTQNSMVRPTVDDATGYLSYGLCQDEMAYGVEFQGQVLPWMALTATYIVVSLPEDGSNMADFAGPDNPWTFLVTHTLTGTVLLENDFVLDIIDLPCSELVLASADQVVDMDVTIGIGAVGEDQPHPIFRDQYSIVYTEGYCPSLEFVCPVWRDGAYTTVDFLTIAGGNIVLTSPATADYIGTLGAKFEVVADGVAIFSRTFLVYVHAPDCGNLDFVSPSVGPIVFQLGEHTQATGAITLTDQDGWLAMGLCGTFDYEVVVDGAALSWVSGTASQVVVTIPGTQTDIGAYVKTSAGSLIVKQDSVVRHQDPFDLTILEPDCNLLELAASAPLRDMTVDIGSPDTSDDQTLPTLVDSFQVLDMGFCTSLTFDLTVDGVAEDWLTLDGTAISLLPPPAAADAMGSRVATFQVLTADATVLLTQDFNVDITGLACTELSLLSSGILGMQFNLGLESEVSQPLPSLSDADDYLAMGLCADQLQYSLEIGLETKSWVYLTPDDIRVKVPDTPSEITTYIGLNTATFIVSVGATRLLEQDFVVEINEPDCAQLVLTPSPAAVSNMAVTIGQDSQATQALPTLDAAFSVFEMGYCQALDYAVIVLGAGGGSEPQTFLTLAGSTLVLEPYEAFDHIETWAAAVEVRVEGALVLELPFHVTITAVHCSAIEVEFGFAAPLEFLLGEQLTATLAVPEAQDAQQLLANGLCGDLVYSLVGVEQASELHQLPWVALEASEVVVSIPAAPADIQAFATTDAAFPGEPTGSITVYSQDGAYLASDSFGLYIRAPACAGVSVVPSHDLTGMAVALDATDAVTQPLASYTDALRVLEMGYCTPYAEVLLNGAAVPFLTLSATEIVLTAPATADYAGAQTATLRVLAQGRPEEGEVELGAFEFEVTIGGPDCSSLDLSPLTLEAMSMPLGDQSQVRQALPPPADEGGFIAMGFCADLEYDLYFGEQLLIFPWLYLEGSDIVLETATSNLVDAPLTITLALHPPGETQTLPTSFDFGVTFTAPACTELVLTAARGLLPMELALGALTERTQAVPHLTDSGSLLALGLCPLTLDVDLDGSSVDFLAVGADRATIVLTAPADSSLVGAEQTGRLIASLAESGTVLLTLEFSVKILPPACANIQIEEPEAALLPMEILLDSSEPAGQPLPTFTDAGGLLVAGLCADFTYRVRLDTPIDGEPGSFRAREVSWLTTNATHIVLDVPTRASYHGAHRGALLVVADSTVVYEMHFAVIVEQVFAGVEAEEAPPAPYFIGVGGLVLPAWEAVAGAELVYLLPESNDSENGVALMQIGSLGICDCVMLVASPTARSGKAIEMRLPSDWTEDATLYVSLERADARAAAVYTIPVEALPAPAPPAPAALAGECSGPLYVDSPCYVDDGTSEEERRALITPADCAPLYAQTSTDGEIRLVFNHPIELKLSEVALAEEIAQSDGLELQLISAVKPEDDGQVQFTWALEKEGDATLLVKVKFADVAQISTNGIDRDQFRIVFVDTGSFLECEAGEEAAGTRRLQAGGASSEPPASNRDSSLISLNTVAEGYVLKVPLPPQSGGGGIQALLEAVSERGTEITAGVALLVGLSQYFDMPLQDLWGGISVVQIVSHLPLNNVNLPYAAVTFFALLNRIVSFNVYAPTDYFDLGFTETLPYNDSFYYLGYRTCNFYENIGFIAVIGAAILLRQLLQPCFCRGLARCGMSRGSCMRRERRRLALSYQKASNIWLRFWLVTFFEFMIASAIGLRLKDRVVIQALRRMTPADHLALLGAWVHTLLIVGFIALVGYMTTFKGRQLALARKGRRKKVEKRFLDDWKEQTMRDLGELAESGSEYESPQRSGSVVIQRPNTAAVRRASETQRTFMRRTYLGYFMAQSLTPSEMAQTQRPGPTGFGWGGRNDVTPMKTGARYAGGSPTSSVPASTTKKLVAGASSAAVYPVDVEPAEPYDQGRERADSLPGQSPVQAPIPEESSLNSSSLAREESHHSSSGPDRRGSERFGSDRLGSDRRSDIEMGASRASEASGGQPKPSDPNSPCIRSEAGLSSPDEAAASEKAENPVSEQEEQEASAELRQVRSPTLYVTSGIVTLHEDVQEFESDSPTWFGWVSELFAGLRQHSGKSIKYNLVHVLRRVVLVLVAMHFHERAWVQALVWVVQSEIAMMLILGVRPFLHPLQNYAETFNEVSVLIIGYHMMVVAGWDMPAWTRDCVGTSGIIFVGVLVAVNVLRWCVHIVQTARLYGKRLLHQSRMRAAVRHKAAAETRKRLALASIETERGLLADDCGSSQPPDPHPLTQKIERLELGANTAPDDSNQLSRTFTDGDSAGPGRERDGAARHATFVASTSRDGEPHGQVSVVGDGGSAHTLREAESPGPLREEALGQGSFHARIPADDAKARALQITDHMVLEAEREWAHQVQYKSPGAPAEQNELVRRALQTQQEMCETYDTFLEDGKGAGRLPSLPEEEDPYGVRESSPDRGALEEERRQAAQQELASRRREAGAAWEDAFRRRAEFLGTAEGSSLKMTEALEASGLKRGAVIEGAPEILEAFTEYAGPRRTGTAAARRARSYGNSRAESRARIIPSAAGLNSARLNVRQSKGAESGRLSTNGEQVVLDSPLKRGRTSALDREREQADAQAKRADTYTDQFKMVYRSLGAVKPKAAKPKAAKPQTASSEDASGFVMPKRGARQALTRRPREGSLYKAGARFPT